MKLPTLTIESSYSPVSENLKITISETHIIKENAKFSTTYAHHTYRHFVESTY
ncbi:TPA: hypothetical protein NG573_004282 [Vibrio parahaemolyticus]|nr:hypothetical protein [Vibrio parahaemolyticus]HCM1038595.1 hypothetical protein [Vibrio parahaemolyticus]